MVLPMVPSGERREIATAVSAAEYVSVVSV